MCQHNIVYAIQGMLGLVDMSDWNFFCCWHLCEDMEALGFNPARVKWLNFQEGIKLYIASPEYKDVVLSLEVSHAPRDIVGDLVVDPA
ncbi:hypothetical protein V6N13_074689 [Hibiscus sabdariffa]|uniref:Uncharacterized protein n=1 Tax=Hibiscus sabdariffa TaxID=183260 RepID=A0ABR2U9R8_9ROSI